LKLPPVHIVPTTQIAQAAQQVVAATPAPSTWPGIPMHWPAQTDLLSWCQTMGPATAAMMIIAGVVYLAFGVYIYRSLMMLNAAIVGVYLGGMIGGRAGNATAGALVGGFAAAALTWPMMKYSVALMGGVFGVLLGASLWRAAGLEPNYAWAGSLSGLIFFGMLSFSLFRGSVMMFFSIQGAVMLVFGALGMIYKYQGLAPQVTQHLSVKPFILPIAIMVPALIGLIYQQTQFPPQAAKK